VFTEVHRQIKQWCDGWLLKINIGKCKAVSLRTTNKLQIASDYHKTTYFIQSENYFKDLSVTFDSSLTFTTHMQQK